MDFVFQSIDRECGRCACKQACSLPLNIFSVILFSLFLYQCWLNKFSNLQFRIENENRVLSHCWATLSFRFSTFISLYRLFRSTLVPIVVVNWIQLFILTRLSSLFKFWFSICRHACQLNDICYCVLFVCRSIEVVFLSSGRISLKLFDFLLFMLQRGNLIVQQEKSNCHFKHCQSLITQYYRNRTKKNPAIDWWITLWIQFIKSIGKIKCEANFFIFFFVRGNFVGMEN